MQNTYTKKNSGFLGISLLGGGTSSTATQINNFVGSSAQAGANLLMASGGSATLVGSQVTAGGQAVLAYGVGPAAKAGASLNLDAAINSTLTQSSSTNNGLVVSTKVADTFTQSLTYNSLSPNVAFVGAGPINIDYQGAVVNETQNSKAPQMPKGFGSWVGTQGIGAGAACPSGVTCTTTNFTPAQIASGLGAANDNLAYLGALNNNPSALVNTAAAITQAQAALQQLGVTLDTSTLTPGGNGINWNALTLTNQSATWQTKSLNPIAQMIMDIALMTVMGPAGGNMLLAAGEAALVSLANSGVNGLISGQFDGGQAFENAAIAALTAALSSGVGDLKSALQINPGNLASGTLNPVATLESALLHGVVGCVGSSLSGQSCGSGFVSGSISDLANVVSTGNTASDLLLHAVIGGTASQLSGGDFATGALNASLAEMFNFLSHPQIDSMNTALNACGNNSDCKQYILQKYLDLSNAQNQQLAACGLSEVCQNNILQNVDDAATARAQINAMFGAGNDVLFPGSFLLSALQVAQQPANQQQWYLQTEASWKATNCGDGTGGSGCQDMWNEYYNTTMQTGARLPDFYTVSGSYGGYISGSGSVVVDRYGNLYVSPGAGAGVSSTPLTLGATANWLSQNSVPTSIEIQNILNQGSYSATAGFIFGTAGTYSPGNGGAVGIGLVSPQIGGGYSYGLQLINNNKTKLPDWK